MLELKKGRPDDYESRAEVEKMVYDVLDHLGVEYMRLDHEPAFTMDICREIDKSLGGLICKNLFLTNRQKTDFYLLMMPSTKVFKTKELSKALGVSRLSFASGEAMEEYLDITPGSLSVMGLMYDKDFRVRLVIDKPVLENEYIGFHPCINTSSLQVKSSDLTGKIIPAMGHEPTIVNLP